MTDIALIGGILFTDVVLIGGMLYVGIAIVVFVRSEWWRWAGDDFRRVKHAFSPKRRRLNASLREEH